MPVLKKNLLNLKSNKSYEIIEKDIYNENIFKNLDDKFDVIFLDPPYKDKNYIKVLLRIEKFNILKKNGL